MEKNKEAIPGTPGYILESDTKKIESLDPNKEVSAEDTNFKVVDYEPLPEPTRKQPGEKKTKPKNFDKKRKARRKLQKKSRKTNRKR